DIVESDREQEVFARNPGGTGATAEARLYRLPGTVVVTVNPLDPPVIVNNTCSELDDVHDERFHGLVLVPGILLVPVEPTLVGFRCRSGLPVKLVHDPEGFWLEDR